MLENQREVFIVRGNTGLFLPRKSCMPSVYIIDAKTFDTEEDAEAGINTRAGEFLAQPCSIYSIILTLELTPSEPPKVLEIKRK